MRTRPHAHHTLVVLHLSKYHCSTAYFDNFSCYTPAGRLHPPFLLKFFHLGWSGAPNPEPYPPPTYLPTSLPACLPANLCDSLATECLPAAESSALQQPSSPLRYPLQIPTDWHPPLPPRLRSAPGKLAPPLVRTFVLNLKLLLHQCVLSNPPPLRLHLP